MVQTDSRLSSASLTLLAGRFAARIGRTSRAGNNLHLQTRNNCKMARQHNVLAGSQSAGHHDVATLTLSQRHDPQLGGLVRLHHVDERPLLADLRRLSRNQDRTFFGGQNEPDVYKLPGPEMAVGIRNCGAQVNSARSVLYRVVEERHFAHAGTVRAVGGKPNLSLQISAHHLFLDVRKIAFSDREIGVDWIEPLDE